MSDSKEVIVTTCDSISGYTAVGHSFTNFWCSNYDSMGDMIDTLRSGIAKEATQKSYDAVLGVRMELTSNPFVSVYPNGRGEAHSGDTTMKYSGVIYGTMVHLIKISQE